MTYSTLTSESGDMPLGRRREAGVTLVDAGSGLPVVLLHGIPGSSHTWAAVGERLAQSHRVVIPDLLGFGESDPPDGDYYMEAQARRIRALLERLGIEDLVLGGHDFGGPVAVTLHRLYPELRIRALILSATNLFTDTYVPLPLRVAPIPVLGAVFFGMLAGNRIGLRLMYEAAAVQKQELPWSRFRRHLTPQGIDLTRRIFHRSLKDIQGNYAAVEGTLAHLESPTLVLWGDRDPFFAVSVAERTHRAIRGSRLRILPATGHFVPEEQPAAVAEEILAFLGSISAPTQERSARFSS